MYKLAVKIFKRPFSSPFIFFFLIVSCVNLNYFTCCASDALNEDKEQVAIRFFALVPQALGSLYDDATESWKAGDALLLEEVAQKFPLTLAYLNETNERIIELEKQAAQLSRQGPVPQAMPMPMPSTSARYVAVNDVPEEDEASCWSCFCCCKRKPSPEKQRLLDGK